MPLGILKLLPDASVDLAERDHGDGDGEAIRRSSVGERREDFINTDSVKSASAPRAGSAVGALRSVSGGCWLDSYACETPKRHKVATREAKSRHFKERIRKLQKHLRQTSHSLCDSQSSPR